MRRLILIELFFSFLRRIINLVRLIPALRQYSPCQLCLRCCTWFRQYWQQLPNLARRLIANLAVGLSILLILQFFHHGRFMHEMQDLGVDWVIKMQRGSTPTKESPRFVLLDIDEYTYQNWHEPVLVPRDKLLTLIKFAVSGQPKVVIVDVDLSYPVNRSSEKLTAEDKALFDYLQYYDNYCTAFNCPHILLVRTFRPSLEFENQDELRPSFLENVVNQSKYIHFASVLFDLERDNVLRRWHLWKTLCQIGVVPSTQLLTAILILNPEQANYLIKKGFEQMLSKECSCQKTVDSEYVGFGKALELSLSPSRLSRRILYNFAWHETAPLASDGYRVLSTLSAHTIISQLGKNALNNEQLKDNIVEIGGSYRAARDIYMTPLGEMPGTLVVINAIHSLLQFGELQPPHWFWMLLFQIVFIVLISLPFAYFENSVFGNWLSLILVICVIIPLSFWLFRYGVWLDFAVSLLIVRLYQTFMDNRALIREIHERRVD